MRTVVVGASSGLGRCLATGLGQRGARVALLARRKDQLLDAAKDAGEGAVAIACDVTQPTSCRDAIEQAAGRFGGIDALVYATGVGLLRRLVEIDADTWRHAFETNVTGAALPYLAAASGAVDDSVRRRLGPGSGRAARARVGGAPLHQRFAPRGRGAGARRGHRAALRRQRSARCTSASIPPAAASRSARSRRTVRTRSTRSGA